MKLSKIKTYAYIDVSNIRYACLRSCNFNIDFIKFYEYLAEKYPKLQEARYYEGVSIGDKKKLRHFQLLEEKVGYKVRSLARKSYIEPAQHSEFRCKKCGNMNTIKTLPSKVKMKSNVDVYLTADMLELVAKTNDPTHIILVSCDGDYAEAIQSALRMNPNVCITVLATPTTKKNNCLSSRLKWLRKEVDQNHYILSYITNIEDKISQTLSSARGGRY